MLFTFINGPLDGQLLEIAEEKIIRGRYTHYEVRENPNLFELVPLIEVHIYEQDGPLMFHREN